jgi:lipopolysaccharide/colanic/teichoic acid biosynthesis glycosyltransferase
VLILGEKYNFSEIEYNRLKKHFKEIKHVKYKDKAPEETIDKIAVSIKEKKKTLIILNTQAILSPKLITYLSKLELQGITYITIENFLETYLQKCFISEELSIDTSFLEDIYDYSTLQYIQKRVIDYIGVFLLFIPTLLAVIYSKYRILKESPGEVFFKQLRVGQKENEFNCIKLRSMHQDAEKRGAQFAEDDDPRTFPWGKVIRYKKIDELMQIWNVIKGEMHLVGPRPERLIWTNEFERSIPYYTQRHLIAPGITGLAQIKYQYGSGKLDAKEKLRNELYYIKYWSVALELQIIWKTILFLITEQREDLSNF